MPAIRHGPVVNRLMDRLPRADRERLIGSCKPVELEFGNVLCEPADAFRHVYFPTTCCISLVATVSGHPPLEMGMIGNEGMLGATLVLAVETVPLRAIVQGAGSALRMTGQQFKRESLASLALTRSVERYLFVLMAQLSQAAACTRFHAVDARLARWLLMTHDRAHSDNFFLTHQFLADMLGVRRSAITLAAGALQRSKLIRYIRGDIEVLNRTGLEEASCECYKAGLAQYRSHLGAGGARRAVAKRESFPANG